MTKHEILDQQLADALLKYEQTRNPEILYWALKHFHAEAMTLLDTLSSIREQEKRRENSRLVIDTVLGESLDVVCNPTQGPDFVAVSLSSPSRQIPGTLNPLSRGIKQGAVHHLAELDRDMKMLKSHMSDFPHVALAFVKETFTKKALNAPKTRSSQ